MNGWSSPTYESRSVGTREFSIRFVFAKLGA